MSKRWLVVTVLAGLLAGSVAVASPAVAVTDADGGTIQSGESVTRFIDPAGDKDTVSFQARSGQRATIRMTKTDGSSLDPFLRLVGSKKRRLAEDDDSGGNLNSLINDFALPKKGKYRIESTGFDRSVGGYTLSLTLTGGTGGGGCNPGSGEVALFRDTGFGGTCVKKGVGDYASPGSLSPLGNDEASSIRVGSGVRAVLYRDDNFNGTSETFTSDDSSLTDNSIGNDQVSSMRVQSTGSSCSPGSDQVALFRDAGFGGACVVKGFGDYGNSGAISPLGNDDVSSIKVGSNARAVLYRDDNFTGTNETFTSDDSNLSDNAIGNDQVSSVRVQHR
jgi:hypothetical protein